MAEAWRTAPLAGQPVAAPDAGGEAWRSAPVVEPGMSESFPKEMFRDPETPWLDRLVTGAGRTEFEDAPELTPTARVVPGTSEESLKLAGAYALSTDPKQIQDVALEVLPGATAKTDKHGNQMVTYEGKDYYVNKPGASHADLVQLLGQAWSFLPAAKFSSGAKSLLGRMFRMGETSALTSVGTDKASTELGSKQGVDYLKAAVAAFGGALFEGLTPLAVRAWRGVFNKNRLFDAKVGQLTEEGEAAARTAGLDPDTMTERLSRSFADEARDAVDPKHAAGRVAGDEFDIPYTRGQATGDYRQIANEEATRHGAFGDDAGRIVRDFDETQQQRMQGAREGIQTELAGGERTIARPAQAGEDVAETVRARFKAAQAEVDAAYKEVGEAWIGSDGFRGLWRRAAESVSDMGIDPGLHPAATKALKNLRKLESQTRRKAKAKVRITSVALKRLETERRKLGHLIDSAANDGDRRAAILIKNSYDEWFEEAMDTALLSGDKLSLAAMKRARAKNTEFRTLYGGPKSKDPAGKLIQRIISDDTITPEQVINNVFGRHGLGQKETSVQILSRMKAIAGEGSADWNVLREAAWLRLAKEAGSDGFSPRKFATKFGKIMDDNRSLMDELFTPDEQAMFSRFRDDVMRTVPPASATNPAKSAYTGARLVREWLGRLGTMFTFSGSPIGGAIFFTMKRVPQVMGNRAARQSVRGLGPATPTAPQLTAPATGAAALGSENIPPISNTQ